MNQRRFLKRFFFGIILCLLGVIFLKFYFNYKSSLQNATLTALDYPQNNYLLLTFTRLNNWIYDFFHFNQIRLKAYYLNDINNELSQKLLELTNLQQENETLRKALNLKEEKKWNLIPAKVIFTDPTGLTGNIWIDKGLKDGIKPGMNVILDNGSLIGVVNECFDYYCEVNTIFTPQTNISSKDINTNTIAILTRSLKGEFIFKLVPHEANIQSNDILVTSNENKQYLQGLIVGKIKNVISEEMSLKEYLVEPMFSFDKLNNVLIITNFIAPHD